MIDILTSRVEMNLSLFAEEPEMEEIEENIPKSFEETLRGVTGEMPEPTEMLMEGKLLISEHRVELVYAESELTGMQGSLTAIGFEPANPDLVSMVRTGPVRTAMTFEEGKRHICLYNTPFSEFEVCVRTIRISNALIVSGKLNIDYVVEIRGAKADRTKFTMQILG